MSVCAQEKSEDLLTSLCESLQDNDTTVVADAVFRIGCMESEASPAIPLLINLCQSPIDHLRREATAALGRINGDPEKTIPMLTELLFDECMSIKRYAAAGLSLYDEKIIAQHKIQTHLEFIYETTPDYHLRNFLGSLLSRLESIWVN